MEIELWNPDAIKIHPVSLELYGDKLDAQVEENIIANGQRTPCFLAADGTCFHGNRRVLLARRLGRPVPVVVDPDLTDPDDILERIIDCNHASEITTVAKLKIAIAIKEIEERRALAKRMANLKNHQETACFVESATVALSRDSESASDSTTAEKVADRLEVSARTAKRAIKAGKVLAEAEATGNTAVADKIRQAKSINEACRIAQSPDQPEPDAAADGPPAWFTELQEMHEGCRKRLNWVIKAMKDVVATPRGEYIAHAQRRVLNHLEGAKNCITQMTPAVIEDGKIVTKMDYESRIKGEQLQAETALKRRARRG